MKIVCHFISKYSCFNELCLNILGVKTDDLPVIRKHGQYQTEEEYFNTYFRLLREECFYKLRKGIRDFVTNEYKCDQKDMMMFR